jgi:hypothetical protein
MQLSCPPERAISTHAMLSNVGTPGFTFSVLLVLLAVATGYVLYV